jgi:site-specific DNA-cytosine methylase
VPVWSAHQHFCMRHTPEGATAFDNLKCPACEHQNPDTEAVCANCKARLPRPSLLVSVSSCPSCAAQSPGGVCASCGSAAPTTTVTTTRLVRAFRTAYRRMRADEPVATLTTNSGKISSDVKGHPSQHRVLSVREVLIAASLTSFPGFDAPWHAVVERVYGALPHRLVRAVAGESIPPLQLFRLVEHLCSEALVDPCGGDSLKG